MKRTALASLFALSLAGAAQAYQPVGGGSATMSGGGDDLTITYSAGGAGGGMATHSQSGRLARFAGSHGDGQLVEYLTSAPANPGPSARLVGGGDNAEVVYDRR
jgi:hypothetical protein